MAGAPRRSARLNRPTSIPPPTPTIHRHRARVSPPSHTTARANPRLPAPGHHPPAAGPHPPSPQPARRVGKRFKSLDTVGFAARNEIGGEGGIRTRGAVARTHAFQACSFGHSDTSPGPRHSLRLRMAERVGFEPTDPVKGQRFSRPPRSTTPAPLRFGGGSLPARAQLCTEDLEQLGRVRGTQTAPPRHSVVEPRVLE